MRTLTSHSARLRRPNILILYCDQLRWDALGANGNPDVRTPHLDRLAAQGLTFRRHFVQNPVCMPSRLSFLTGRYPSALRVTHMGVPVPPDTLTLPRMLKPYGYASANVGKLHFLPHANRDHRAVHPDYGFDVLEISDEPGCYEDAYRAWVRRVAPEHLDAISCGLPPMAQAWYRALGVRDTVTHPEERFPKEAIPFRAPSHLTHTAFVAERAMDFIRARSGAMGASGGIGQSGQPWLCIAGFYSPHSPWIAPQEFLDLYDSAAFTLPAFPAEVEARRAGAGYADEHLREARRGYYAMVSEVDHHCGRILALLEELGQAEDTVVVLTADHGDWLGEHLRHGKGYPASDAVSRVPLLVRWPAGIRQPGRAVAELVEAVDVLPTLLECAGAPVPPEVQGRSLWPALVGPVGPVGPVGQGEGPGPGRGEEDEGGWQGRESALTEHHGWKALRTERYRYVCDVRSGRMEEHLWDLEADPGEYVDVAGDPAQQAALAEHRRLLVERMLTQEQPLPRAWAY
jgi:arylsulfatase